MSCDYYFQFDEPILRHDSDSDFAFDSDSDDQTEKSDTDSGEEWSASEAPSTEDTMDSDDEAFIDDGKVNDQYISSTDDDLFNENQENLVVSVLQNLKL